MKRAFLLAGSLGLLGVVAQTFPAIAASEDSLQQSTAQLTPETAPSQNQPLLLADKAPVANNSVTDLIKGINQDSLNQRKSAGQVTSVSQLSDIQPTDWAFQALQSLVERYGCIAGYPDGTFRGNRAATRYELAAALNACLDSLDARFATQEDLAALKALQDEFAAELATLRGRVDALEARTKTLEAQQFSTTTKLQGEAVIAFQAGGTTEDGTIPFGATTGDERTSVLARVRLSFNSSFTGSDLLQTQLQGGNGGQDLFAALGIGTPVLDAGVSDFAGVGNTFTLRRLAYSFKPAENLSITVGPLIFPADFFDFNSYANNSAQDFSSGFFINNPLTNTDPLDVTAGAGGAITWNVAGGPFTIRALYVAGSPANAVANDFGGGFTGDPYQASAELEFADTFGANDRNSFAVRLQYTRATSFNFTRDVAGLNAEATFGRFGIFGRYGWAPTSSNGIGGATDPDLSGFPNNAGFFGGVPSFALQGEPNFTAQAWMAGVAVKDLFVPGSLLAAAVGQPGINNLPAIGTINDATQTNYEAFYRFPVNDNITVTPTIMVITDANNSSTSPTIFQGLLRTTFSF